MSSRCRAGRPAETSRPWASPASRSTAPPGRGGGWSLVGGARTDLSGLTVDEARALFLAAGPATEATPGVQAALRKLLAALPAPLRRGAEAASSAVVVDATTWGRTPPPEPEYLGALRQAVLDERQVVLGYIGPGRPTVLPDRFAVGTRDEIRGLVPGRRNRRRRPDLPGRAGHRLDTDRLRPSSDPRGSTWPPPGRRAPRRSRRVGDRRG